MPFVIRTIVSTRRVGGIALFLGDISEEFLQCDGSWEAYAVEFGAVVGSVELISKWHGGSASGGAQRVLPALRTRWGTC